MEQRFEVGSVLECFLDLVEQVVEGLGVVGVEVEIPDRRVHGAEDGLDQLEVGVSQGLLQVEQVGDHVGGEPALEAVAGLRVRLLDVAAPLDPLEDASHPIRGPRLVIRVVRLGDPGDLLPVAVVRVDGDQGVVRRAAPQGPGAGVQDALALHVLGIVLVALSRRIGVVLDEEIPAHLRVLCRLGVERRDVVVQVLVFVAGLDQKDLEPRAGKVGGDRSAAAARANDDIIELRGLLRGHGSSSSM